MLGDVTFTPRHLLVPPPRFVDGWWVKPYHVNIDDRPIEDELVDAAYEFLPRLLPAPDDATPAVAFAVVHRGRKAMYLNAYAWVWDNVLHCRTAAAAEAFLGCPDDDPTHFVELTRPFIGCIWELPPLEHERAAWVRHVFGTDTADLPAYLADTMAPGPVGP
jgi:hypothetical protein